MIAIRPDTQDEQRLALMFASNLKRAGITVRVRTVDAVQFETRRIAFDFDMIQNRWDESLSPGNEQAFYWSAAAADQNGSRNYMGVKSPAVDAMIADAGPGAAAQRRGGGGAGARPGADLGRLHGAAVSSFRRMGRALDANPASCGDVRIGLLARNLVAAAEMKRKTRPLS